MYLHAWVISGIDYLILYLSAFYFLLELPTFRELSHSVLFMKVKWKSVIFLACLIGFVFVQLPDAHSRGLSRCYPEKRSYQAEAMEAYSG
jgi:hypothetical protein